MRNHLLLLPALLGASAFLFVGCESLSSSETTGPYSGANAGLAASDINRASTAATGGLLATGSPGSAISVAVLHVIVKHQASARQRQLARQRARATYAHLVAQQRTASAQAPHARSHGGAPGAKVAAAYHIPKIPRFICVETSRDEHTAPGAAKAVMIWDTQSQEIVGNNVYDINTAPAIGATSRLETYSAEYVGAGL